MWEKEDRRKAHYYGKEESANPIGIIFLPSSFLPSPPKLKGVGSRENRGEEEEEEEGNLSSPSHLGKREEGEWSDPKFFVRGSGRGLELLRATII